MSEDLLTPLPSGVFCIFSFHGFSKFTSNHQESGKRFLPLRYWRWARRWRRFWRLPESRWVHLQELLFHAWFLSTHLGFLKGKSGLRSRQIRLRHLSEKFHKTLWDSPARIQRNEAVPSASNLYSSSCVFPINVCCSWIDSTN